MHLSAQSSKNYNCIRSVNAVEFGQFHEIEVQNKFAQRDRLIESFELAAFLYQTTVFFRQNEAF